MLISDYFIMVWNYDILMKVVRSHLEVLACDGVSPPFEKRIHARYNFNMCTPDKA